MLYLAAEHLPDRDELFAYDLGTGARRRLSLPLTIPGDGEVEWFSISPDGDWVLFGTSNLVYTPHPIYGPPEFYAAPTDGSAPAWRLPHPPLGNALTGYTFMEPAVSVVLVEGMAESAQTLFSFDLHTGELTQIDAPPSDEIWTYVGGQAEPSTGLLVLKLRAGSSWDDPQRVRYRLVDPSGTLPTRWIGGPFEYVFGDALLANPPRLIVAGRTSGSTAAIVRIHDLNTEQVTSWDVFTASGSDPVFSGILPPEDAATLALDRTRNLLFYSGGGDLRRLDLVTGADTRLRALATDAGLDPSHIRSFSVLFDETGRARIFCTTYEDTWHLDPGADADSAPVQIAPFRASAIAAVHAASDRVIVQTDTDPVDDMRRSFHLASLIGGAPPRLLGAHGYTRYQAPPAYLTAAGDRLLFPEPTQGLVLAELDSPAIALRLVSPPWAVVGYASIRSVSPTRAHATLWVDEHGLYLATLATGELQKIGDSLPGEDIRWSADGRWVLWQGDWNRHAADTLGEFPPRLIAATLSTPVIGTGLNDFYVYAGRQGRVFRGDLRNEDHGLIGTLPEPVGRFIFPKDNPLSPDGSTLAVQVSDAEADVRDIWLIPLHGGPLVKLPGAIDIPAPYKLMGMDASHVYAATYTGEFHKIARDGSERVRLNEAASPSNIAREPVFQIDLGRRLVVYVHTYPDGTRRVHSLSLDADELGLPAMATDFEGGDRLVMRAGIVLCLHEGDVWAFAPGPGTPPVRITTKAADESITEFDLSPDGRIAFVNYGKIPSDGSFLSGGRDIRRYDLETGGVTRLLPPTAVGTEGFIMGRDDREIWFAGTLENPWAARIYRARLPDMDAPAEPDGLDHPGYAAWIVASDLPAGLEAATEDADGDGVANLLEYLHGSDARDPSARPEFALTLQAAPLGANEWTLAYASHDLRRPGWAWPQVSSDLVTWFDVPGRLPLDFDAASPAEFRWPVGRIFDSRAFYRLRFELAE